MAIARAIVIEPPLVLMDEPLSNLDAKLRLEMRAEIRRIHELIGSTTIYVTHDQDEALSLADRIVVMRDGMVRQVGTPEELYARPAHLDVAEFMGFRNLLARRVSSRASEASVSRRRRARSRARPIEPLAGRRRRSSRSGPTISTPRADGAGSPPRSSSVEYRGRDFCRLRPRRATAPSSISAQRASGAAGRNRASRRRSDARADLSGGAS